MQTATIPYGPEHRNDLERFIGQPFKTVTYDDQHKATVQHVGHESLCGITYDCWRLADSRVYVARTDRYTCYTQATIFQDYAAWSQWWHVDRKRGERDPETGRYRD